MNKMTATVHDVRNFGTVTSFHDFIIIITTTTTTTTTTLEWV